MALAGIQVLGEGKNVEKAIENGLAKMQVTRDRVEIEVVEEPSRVLFGLRTSRAVVRLTLKEPERTEVESAHAGVLSVKGGKLEYIAPDIVSETVPRISFGSEFHVLYHGEPRTSEVKLTEGLDPLEIRLPARVEPELHYEIVVDAKQTKAQLVWKRSPGVTYSLADHRPTNDLKLILVQTILDPPALGLKDVLDLVRIEGLTYGLQVQGLTEEALSASEGSYLIAAGEDPKPPRHPSIKYVFQEGEATIDDGALRIDHYAVHGTTGVQEGDILAIKNPGKRGEAGVDVYGKPIEGEPLKQVKLTVGDGVRLSEDGLQIIATASGLPSLQGGVIRVTSVFELPGDADVSTGNITMDGDIIIRGSVQESVKVQSNTGVIVVNGLVSGGTLRTSGSITVLRNAVRAQLHAGGVSVIQIRILNLLRKISSQLETLEIAYEAIVSQADNIPFENLIRHLVELKFSTLPKDIKELADEMERIRKGSEEDKQQYASLAETISNCLLAQGSGLLRVNDIQELHRLRQGVDEQIVELQSQTAVEANVKVGYLQNSNVEASGSVEVTGKGCFYSTVMAGTGFRIPAGVFRGGEVTVHAGNIVAKELGGPKGIATTAQVLRAGNISATLVHPNVTVAIGSQSYKFDEPFSMIKVYLQQNILTISSGSVKIHG